MLCSHVAATKQIFIQVHVGKHNQLWDFKLQKLVRNLYANMERFH